jgi:hypothetical protein
LLTPVIVFDQFEELFRRAVDPAAWGSRENAVALLEDRVASERVARDLAAPGSAHEDDDGAQT